MARTFILVVLCTIMCKRYKVRLCETWPADVDRVTLCTELGLTIGLSSESLSSWSTRERIEAGNFSVRLAVHAKERLVRAENKRNRGNRKGKDWSKWICASTYTDYYVCVLIYE